jgi:RND family efflux transporter MFP subunit
MFTWSYKSTIIATLTILIGAVLAYQAVGTGSAQTNQPTATSSTATTSTTTATASVETVSVTGDTNTITTTGEVRGQLSATISSQISGVISSVPATIGQPVNRSDVLAVFENQSEKASVRQAQANVATQQANLSELQNGSRKEEVSNAQLAVEKAQDDVKTARQQLFDTDLQAYLEAGDQAARSGNLQPPTISGTYTGDERGEYKIELYSSGAKSGYSFRYSGLESGIGTVSTDTPMPLGDRGLYIQFPENFASNQLLEWVIPVPNTRSNQLSSAESRYRQAKIRLEEARNNLLLTRKGVREEQIAAAQARVDSARASLQQSQAQLDKTTVEAPFAGEVLSVSVDPGQFVSVGQSVAKLVNRSQIEIRAALAPRVASNLAVGDTVQIGKSGPGRIVAIAPAVDSDTGNVEVRIAAESTEQTDLIPGTYVDLVFTAGTERQSTRQTLPLSAVGTTADSSYVLVVDDNNTLRRVELETGAVTGSTVVVEESLPSQPIVRDISGLSADQQVRVVNNSIRDE